LKQLNENPETNFLAGNGIESETRPDTVANGQDLLKDEIVSEHLTRNIQFFGLESQHKVTGSYVVVIGLGGVGSHAASMLLRSGVGKLLLVDFDQVSLVLFGFTFLFITQI
jgi:molybdopterin/thiamine biosynthesis adenylyltransferase